MCGIAGVISYGKHFRPESGILRRMAEPLRFRGPDQEGYLELDINNSLVSLAHKRLSIIDLSNAGRQPMESPSGMSIIVFNGEIYNYAELRDLLEKQGVRFRSHSDTEVILAAYETWGIQRTLDKLEGMFAFFLYDKKEDIALIARDRFGEKPLYYHHNRNFLAFSSDIRSFYVLPVPLSVNPYALGYYFAELSTPAEQSIWKEIRKLPPAHFLEYRQGNISLHRYWELDYRQKCKDTLPEAVEKCAHLLEASISKRLVADVPVGTFLSGGIDSSLVTLLAASHYPDKINTFSVGFSYEHYNELPYARVVAEQAGSKHHELTVDPMDAAVFDNLIMEYGEPFADSSMIPSYFVSKFAAEHVKVVLGGDGGDEIFGGYRTYNQGYRMHQWHQYKNWLRPIVALARWSGSPKADYLHGILNYDPATIASALYRNMGFSSSELRILSEDPSFYSSAGQEYSTCIREAMQVSHNIFDCLLSGSIKTRLVNDYFVKVDRASMFASLEVRTPFVDRQLAEYTASLPPEMILHKGVNKYITKKIAGKYFSDHFIHRPKMGFGIPIGEWIRNELKDYFRQYIIDTRQDLFDIDEKYVRKIYDDHIAGKADNKDKLWLIFVLHRWVSLQTSTK